MAASSVRPGYGAVLGRQDSNLTTIAASTTGSSTPQSRTPALMTSITQGTVLCIDTASTTVKEVTKVNSVTGSTFTSIIENNHSGGISVALQVSVAELVAINGFRLRADLADATHLNSDDQYRQFIQTMLWAEVDVEGNYTDDASQVQIVTDAQAGTLRTWSIALGGTPGAASGNQCVWWAKAYVEDLVTVASVADIIRFTAKLKISGKAYLHY